MTRKAVELTGAIGAGIGLWRFTSGDWLGGIVLALVVAAVVGWTWWDGRVKHGGRRY